MSPLQIPRLVWLALGVLILAAIALSPGLTTGYWGEDTYYSTMVRGGLVINGNSLADALVHYEKHNFHVGRFFPATPLITTLVFYAIHDVFFYKCYLVAMTLVDLALFVLLIRKLGGSRGFAGFAGCVVVSLFQFRIFIDPILAYYGQIQWMTAALFVSLLGLLFYLDGRGRSWLAFSAVAYLAAALTYEVAYTLAALHFLLIAHARRGWRSRLIPAIPFLGVVGFCGGMSFLMRRLYPGNLYLQSPRLDPRAVVTALAEQTTAALPLSYLTCDPLKIFDHVIRPDLLTDPRISLLMVLALGLSYASLRQGANRAVKHVGLGLVIGLILAIFPGVLIAISPYHQNYLTFGVGWICVMTEYFGVALVLALGLWQFAAMPRLGGAFGRPKCVVASILVASVIGVTCRANQEVASCFNASPGTERYREFAGQHGAAWHLPRLNIEAALDAGLMDGVPAYSTVQIAHQYPYWHDPAYGPLFYAKHSKKPLFVVAESTGFAANPTYQVRDDYQGRATGFVVLSVVSFDGSTLRKQALRLFLRDPQLSPSADFTRISLVQSPSGRVFRPGRELPMIRSGRGWASFALDSTADRINPDTLQIVDASTRLPWIGDQSIAGRERANSVK